MLQLQIAPCLKVKHTLIFLGGLGLECYVLNKTLLKYMLGNVIRTEHVIFAHSPHNRCLQGFHHMMENDHETGQIFLGSPQQSYTY